MQGLNALATFILRGGFFWNSVEILVEKEGVGSSINEP
jgi:hypothetical protein